MTRPRNVQHGQARPMPRSTLIPIVVCSFLIGVMLAGLALVWLAVAA